MPKYKITTGSVANSGNNTHMKVTFIRDDGTASEEQHFEVASLDEVRVYEELDKGAESWEKLGEEKVAPTLVENKELEVGVEAQKARDAKEAEEIN